MRLYQAKAGHHYTRTRLFGSGPIVTYRITEEGLDYLRKRRIGVGDGISQEVLTFLRDRDWAFTSGSGVGGQGNLPVLTDLLKRITPELKAHFLPLRLQTRGNNCSLECWIPPITQKSISRDRAYLKREWAGIDGEHVPLSDLIAGAVGYWQRVSPHEGNYEVDFRTTALPAYFSNEWKLETPGLIPAGTLFHSEEEGGTRLLPSQGVLPAKAYCLILQSKQQLPSNVIVARWRPLNNWQVADVIMPEEIDDECEEWLLAIGQFVESEPLVVRFIAPPAVRFTGDVLPVTPPSSSYIVGIEGIKATSQSVIVEVRSEGDTLERFTCTPNNPLWINLGSLSRGRYVLLVVAGRQSKAYVFQVAATEQPSAPGPISVSLHVSGDDTTLHGTWESTDNYKLELDSLSLTDDTLKVVGISPSNIPITLEYTSGAEVIRDEYSDAATLLEALPNTPTSESSRLRFDGGSFGAITLTPRLKVRERPEQLPLNMQAKARWLTAVLRHRQRDEARRPLATHPAPALASYLSALALTQDPAVAELLSVLKRPFAVSCAGRYWPHLAALSAAVKGDARE